ncbi:hypothetical protein ACNKHL_16825 [Shigella flexneri]
MRTTNEPPQQLHHGSYLL